MKSLAALLAARGSQASKLTNPRYGRVLFTLRRRFQLSVSECLLADVIAILSRKSGWCFASRTYLAELFGISTRTLQRMLATLKDRELIEQHPSDPRRLRPTKLWTNESESVST